MNFIQNLIKIQENIANRVKFKKVKNIERILCLDAAYKKDKVVTVAVLYDLKKDEVLEVYYRKDLVRFPYIPGLLFFREGNFMVKLIKKVKKKYDLIIVDGHGLSHPRMAGLATYVGVITNKPTIGIAKKYLFGDVIDDIIYLNNTKVGIKINRYYFSIGSNIDFDSLKIFIEKINFTYPKAMKIADKLSKCLANKLL
ncbi:MAG: endonuclease V [Nanopusillaceae archaeon]